MYRQVEAEASIPEERKFYCPNSRCSALIVLEGEALPDSPQVCPACSHKICAYCRVVWHKGFDCAEYQDSRAPTPPGDPPGETSLATSPRGCPWGYPPGMTPWAANPGGHPLARGLGGWPVAMPRPMGPVS
ncbi:hypothetical protein N2152v2_002582 [Parachlorella kessleri]